jgi:DNA-binding transcriptional LysR family regulator
MDLLQLEYFRKVAKLNHLTQAAQELHITQPSLSQTIAKLEKDLGVPLFDRQARKISLNQYGKVFLEKVDAALALLEEGKREITDMAGLDQGTVSIDTTFLPQFSEFINNFRSTYPDVRFRISQVSTKENQEQLLGSGEIDFYIACKQKERNGITHLPIHTEEIVLAVPFSHPLAGQESIRLNDVVNESFIHFKKGHSFREDTDELCKKAGFTPNIVCETDDYKTIVELVKSGIGIAFSLESIVDKENPFHYLRIEEPICQRTYQLVWSKKRYLSSAARMFRDLLTEHYANEIDHI